MKLLRKKEKTLPEKLIDIEVLNLKTQPYEWKENLLTGASLLIPLATFIAGVAVGEPVIAAAGTAFSILPAMIITMFATNKAESKHKSKIETANEFYEDKSKSELSELEKTVIKLSEKQLGFKEGEMPEEEVFAKAQKLRELKIRRDARDIPGFVYKNEFEKLN